MSWEEANNAVNSSIFDVFASRVIVVACLVPNTSNILLKHVVQRFKNAET